MTRVLITGCSGFVGSHLLDYLIANTDWDIFGMVRWRSPLTNIQQHIPRVEKGDRLRLIDGNLRDSESLWHVVRMARPDYVFHLAAQSFPKTSFTSPIDTLDTNALGTCRLLEAVREHAPKAIVHICASSEVFGRVSADELPIGENCRFHPASPYAISKVGTDLLGRYYAEAYGMNVQTTRMFSHTGPRRGDCFAESNFAKQIAFIERGLIEPVIKVGNLKSMRTWADVRDAVRAYHMLLTVNPIPGAYYNIGGEHSCTVGEMLETLIKMSPVRPQIVEDPERLRPIDADLQIPDTSKFRAHTGWKPEIPFKRTMQDLLVYWRQQAINKAAVTYR
ncbi:MAG: GDP-mannose 4,6-dehydratase [Hyphomicrobium sp.]|jgi:GDPmannose 4,6-dehydratase